MNDAKYMKLAVELAKKGSGKVNPNPMVGALIVKDGEIIGKGYHKGFGMDHAEIDALKNCTSSPKGATLYVTLEPCCHYGKTPPCTDAIIKSGISRVVIGTLDVNPLVSGNGVRQLTQNNIHTKTGILREECDDLIKVFKKFTKTKTPFVLMKYAMTMDGKTATSSGASRWITCEESRHLVHQLRNDFSAIMVGVNTIIKDDPLLNCRIANGKNPIRIICDTNLRTPLSSRIVKTANEIETYIATNCLDKTLITKYGKLGCKFIHIEKYGSHINLKSLMKTLGEMNIDSILLEGGGMLNWSFLKEQLVDEIYAFIAPKLFGGPGNSPIEGLGVSLPKDSFKLKVSSISNINSDILIKSEVIYPCSQEL